MSPTAICLGWSSWTARAPPRTAHNDKASKRKLDFSQLNLPSAAPPPVLIGANQAGQEGIATLPVLVISMQAV